MYFAYLESDNDGRGEIELSGGGDDSLGDHVAPHDSAENVDEDGVNLGIFESLSREQGEKIRINKIFEVQVTEILMSVKIPKIFLFKIFKKIRKTVSCHPAKGC